MKLSLHTDYGLRLLMYLAGSGERVTAGEVAEFFGISRDHTAKVAQRIVRAGWARSTRGIGGGLELARDPSAIRVGEVISTLEGNTHLLDCVCAEQDLCRIQQRCKLRKALAKAERLQMEYLNSVTLRDLVKPGRPLEAML
jgi:Rrf2 family transcriptional regulator, nitric oxide-sensitive transcriptional repressor